MVQQKGSAQVIVIGVLVIALVAALGLIFWQNVTQKNNSDTPTSETTKNTSEQLPASEKGTIVGSLTYPSESIPSSVEVHATNITTGEDFITTEHLSGSQYRYGIGYSLSVPAGNYYIYALNSAMPGERAYYTNFVECNFNQAGCDDPTKKITVTVESGKTTKDIMAGDWYNLCSASGATDSLPAC